ncbi:phage tail protein [Enterocloster bolteae]|uniref:phage tail-collar fiber domain-containing protein n=1 Tax=Enterocloster bolteae TaxID=208479 RepID=UPI00290C8B38|nr:phage tail protein [Enterocloster bolteae]MDU3288803.1 phage tail protein [Enterocloster bolteae]
MAGTVLTNKGLALITKLMAAQATLSFSRVAVGTGRVPSGYDAQNMTGLNEYKMDATIESCGVSTEQSDVAYIVTQISSVGVSTGFAITEAGVFATDPDDGEILYAYLDLTQDPQYIYASTDAISKFAEITFNVLVGSVTSVTAIVSPGALVKKSEFDNLKTRVEDVETPEFDASGTAESITDKTSLLASFVTKMPLVKFMRNVVAGFKLVLYSGQIVNNCVTDRPDLPGSAAQLKVLMDLYTVLNTKIIKAPDYKNYKSVSLPFTAPNDGYICGGVYSLGTTACYIYVNSTQVGWNHSGGGSNTASPFMYPLSKGDIVTAIGYDQFQAYFIYTK